jgi:hypothetical protein
MNYLTGSKGKVDGGQVLVADPGLAGAGEHLDVARPRVAYVHHDRPVVVG